MIRIILTEQQVKEYLTIALINRGNGTVTPEKIKLCAKTVTEHTGEQKVISFHVEVEA